MVETAGTSQKGGRGVNRTAQAVRPGGRAGVVVREVRGFAIVAVSDDVRLVVDVVGAEFCGQPRVCLFQLADLSVVGPFDECQLVTDSGVDGGFVQSDA